MIERIDPIDASFIAFDSPSTPQIIAALVVLDGVPDIATVRARMIEITHRFPRLTTRLQRRYPLGWLPDDAPSVDVHLTVRTFSHNPSLSELEQASAEEITQPFAEQLSPWSISLFIPDGAAVKNNNRDRLRSAFFLRIHHALGDGLSGVQIGLALTESLKSYSSPESNAGPSQMSETRRPHLRLAAVLRLARQFLAPRTKGFLTCQNSVRRRLFTLDFDRVLLRRRKTQFAVTYNDIILELVSNALRLYSISSGQRPEKLQIMLPVALRLRRSDRGTLGNHLAGVIVKLPTAVSDRGERLRFIHAQTSALKSNGAVGAANLLAQLSARLPFALQRRITKLYARQSHFICTNTPVSNHPLIFARAPVGSVYLFSALLPGHAIGMSFASYAEKTCVALNIDSASSINPEKLRASLEQSYLELVAEN